MQYLKPEMDIVNLEVINIITASVTEGENGTTDNEDVVTPPSGSWG